MEVRMIIDVTGIELTPGENGVHCLGNGEHWDGKGNPIPCCCDECDYWMCCNGFCSCVGCEDVHCPVLNRT